MNYSEPPFLERVFMWNGDGYAFDAPANVDLGDDRLLQGDERWITLAAILRRAQRGDFAPLEYLPAMIRDDAPPSFVASCLWLLGDAAPSALAARLSAFMQPGRPTYTRVKACDAALHAGIISLAPAMLHTWATIVPRERALISVYLSDLLGDEGGSISAYDDFYDEEAYRLHVTRVTEKIDRDFPKMSIFRGEPISLDSILHAMFEALRSEEEVDNIQPEFSLLRHRLEAMTGWCFSEAYRDEVLQPLAAAAVVEECWETCRAKNYEPGVRYFFGHRIPDD